MLKNRVKRRMNLYNTILNIIVLNGYFSTLRRTRYLNFGKK